MKIDVIRYSGGFIFRPATIEDIAEIATLEKEVWGDNAASKEQIKSRIEIFPLGNFVAEYVGNIVAFCSYEYVDGFVFEGGFSWDEITDNGYIKNSHKPNGGYGYGINLSVHYSTNGKRLGDRMSVFGLLRILDSGKGGSFVGSRIPGFSSYKKRNPDVLVEDYISLKRNGRLRDYELNLYSSNGFKILKILPDYFPDKESQNYGVLVYKKNDFKHFPLFFRCLASRLIWFFVNRMIDKEIKKKLKK
jgi:ribosomal protein S18 acetylase RimI-like enzyme